MAKTRIILDKLRTKWKYIKKNKNKNNKIKQ